MPAAEYERVRIFLFFFPQNVLPGSNLFFFPPPVNFSPFVGNKFFYFLNYLGSGPVIRT